MTPCAYRRESSIGGKTIYHCLLLQASPAPCEGCTQASETARGIRSWVVPHDGINTEPLRQAMQKSEEESKAKAEAKAEAKAKAAVSWPPCRHRRRKMRLSCCARYACKCATCPLFKQEVTIKQCNECQWRQI